MKTESKYIWPLAMLAIVTVAGAIFGHCEAVSYLYVIFVVVWLIFTAWYTGAGILELSGFNTIEEKLRGKKDDEFHSSFFIWFFAIYIGLFGLASQRYETSIDRLQLKETIFDTYISGNNLSFAFEMIPDIQSSQAPVEPNFYLPLKTVYSFFSQRITQNKLIEKTKNVVSKTISKDRLAIKGLDLEGIDLSSIEINPGNNGHVSLTNTNLRGASFNDSPLIRHVDFSHSKLDLSTTFINAKLVRVNFTKLGGILTKNKIDIFASNLCMAKEISTFCGVSGINPNLKNLLQTKCPNVYKCG